MREFLLVDDLIDSGSTLDYFIKKTKLVQGEEFHVATLHWNPYGRFQMKPDFYNRSAIQPIGFSRWVEWWLLNSC